MHSVHASPSAEEVQVLSSTSDTDTNPPPLRPTPHACNAAEVLPREAPGGVDERGTLEPQILDRRIAADVVSNRRTQ